MGFDSIFLNMNSVLLIRPESFRIMYVSVDKMVDLNAKRSREASGKKRFITKKATQKVNNEEKITTENQSHTCTSSSGQFSTSLFWVVSKLLDQCL